MNRRIPYGLFAGAALLGATGCSNTGTAGTGGGAPGSIVLTISGEVLALGGYAFPPADMNAPAFVDGWEVRFSEVLVTVDRITLSESPDLYPGDQSQTGPLVAEVDGPWAVDLHQGGDLLGKGGGGERAVALTTLDNQNKNGGKPFDPTVRYAFGFDVVPATAAAKMVQITTAEQMADYATMVDKGYTVLYVGTATFKGTSCAPPVGTGEFGATFPTVVSFKLGFTSPTSYFNCQNPDNDPAKPLGTEEHERGIAVAANTATIGQLTIHTDHPFWESFVHDSPAHFDMIAAQHTVPAGMTAGAVSAVLEDTIGVDPTAITDKQKHVVPWRTCDGFYTPPGMGPLSFDTTGIQVSRTGDAGQDIHDLYDFMTYNQSTQGHLNSDGLCFVERHYLSPP
jgi:hypothetical protein